jgi:hypothetical protein
MGINGTYNEIKTLAKGFYEDARATRAGIWAEKTANNGIAKAKHYVNEANVVGRDATFTAKRTINASNFNGKSLMKHAAIGAGVGAVGNTAMAYGDGDRNLGSAAFRGAMLGGGLGLGVGVGRTLGRGYAAQAETRFGTQKALYEPARTGLSRRPAPKPPGMFQRFRNRVSDLESQTSGTANYKASQMFGDQSKFHTTD